MGKRINICILITIAFLALLLSFTSGPVARAQTQTDSTSSTSATMTASIFSSTSISSTPTTSAATANYSSTWASTSTVSITSTSTSATSNSTSSMSTYSSSITVTMTSTTTTVATLETSTSSTSDADYSISFSPVYWPCTNVLVTFTGPLVESGFYGDMLQFQYFQYNPSYPSVLDPIFTDSGLTVTSDTVSYWINYNEYAQVNFAYLPNIAVKVVDVTPKSNGYNPGLIFMELTNITTEASQYCQYNSPASVPEFQAEWLMIMASVVLGLLFLRVHKHYRSPEKDSKRAERNRNLPCTTQ